MIFDYREMIKSATGTGQPVTRACQLGCDGNTSAPVTEKTIDTTAKVVPPTLQSEKLFPLSDVRWMRQASVQRPQYALPSLCLATPNCITRERVDDVLRQLDRSGTPACMRDSPQVDFYISLVGYEFISLSNWAKGSIIHAVGGNSADVERLQSHSYLDDFLPWAVKKLNRSPVISALVLGNLMNLKPELCFSTFPESAQQRVQYSLETSVEDATPKSLVVSGTNFKRMHMDIQRDLNESITKAVCHYSDGKNDIFALAVRVEGEHGKDLLKIGMKTATAHLLSRDMIVTHEKAPVLICVDIKVAISFRAVAREGRVFDRTGVIVSGFAGGKDALKGLLLSDVAGHFVTIVSTPGQEGWDWVDLLAKRCLENGAAGVNVYPWPIVQGDTPNLSPYKPEVQDALLAKTTDLNALELLSQKVAQIRHEALPTAEMPSWEKNMLLPEAATARTECEQICLTDFEIVTFDQLPDAAPREDSTPVAVRQMFTPHYTTLIWGPSNAGKSWMGIELAISLTTGTPFLYFTPSAPCKLCYLDGEVGSDFKARGNQLLQGREECLPLLNKNLHVISSKGGLNILDRKTQEDLISKLQEAEVKYMVIDNLLSLAPAAAKSNSTPLFDFIHRVEKLGISVIVLHHAGKTGKDFKGPVDLVSLCQNVIHLEGRNQLVGDDGLLSPELTGALGEDGPVVRMTIEKCKIAPELECREMVYKLPVGGTWAFVEGDMPVLAQEGSSKDPEGSDHDPSVARNNLSPAQQKTYNFFVQSAEKDVTNKNIQNLLGVKEGASRNVLKALEQMGHIERRGTDNQTTYRLKK